MNRDEIVCSCLEISRGTIEDAITQQKLTKIIEVQEATEAGTVCGACVDDIYQMLEAINGKVEE